MNTPRVVVIGLDSVDRDLVDMWVAEGELPTFQALQGRAAIADVTNPFLLDSGCTWSSFGTGMSPAKSGQYEGSRYFNQSTYREESYTREQLPQPAFWEQLSDAGKSCAVIDVPFMFPVRRINGIEVVDRSGHVPAGAGNMMQFSTNPPELADEILELFGPTPGGQLSSGLLLTSSAKTQAAYLEMLRARVRNKTQVLLHLLKKQDWDLFLSVIIEAHGCGHLLWHIHDPSHPNHRPEMLSKIGDPIKTIYKEIDKALGEIMDAVGDDTLFAVYLSHGMRPRYCATYLLDRILARIEGITVPGRRRWELEAARALWRRLPGQIRHLLKPLRRTFYNDGFLPNRKGRKFFEVIVTDRVGGVRINLKGRESNGLVEPGREYDEICSMLVEQLSAIRKVPSGAPLALRVERTRDHYSGPAIDRLPDLLVEWNDEGPIEEVGSPATGRLNRQGLKGGRTGDHRPLGRLYACGPGLRPGHLNEPVNSVDMGPTIASILGVALSGVDGQCVDALVPGVETVSAGDVR